VKVGRNCQSAPRRFLNPFPSAIEGVLNHPRSTRRPLKKGWRTLPSADFARYSISASSSGSTQMPRCAIRYTVRLGFVPRRPVSEPQTSTPGLRSRNRRDNHPAGSANEKSHRPPGRRAAKFRVNWITRSQTTAAPVSRRIWDVVVGRRVAIWHRLPASYGSALKISRPR
jgi:hypothetical protein